VLKKREKGVAEACFLRKGRTANGVHVSMNLRFKLPCLAALGYGAGVCLVDRHSIYPATKEVERAFRSCTA